jgi:hypothetical protein
VHTQRKVSVGANAHPRLCMYQDYCRGFRRDIGDRAFIHPIIIDRSAPGSVLSCMITKNRPPCRPARGIYPGKSHI